MQNVIGKSLHLSIQSKEIHITQKEAPIKYDDILVDRSISINALNIDEAEEKIKRSLLLVRLVEGFVEMLTVCESEVVFHRYINHDFEKPKSFWEQVACCENGKMKYKTLSYEKIANKMNIPKSTCKDIRDRSIQKIIDNLNCEERR
jgi:hypothetical protein